MADVYQEIGRVENGEGNEINRRDIQAAIAKAVELRALHAALVQGSIPASARLRSVSPVSRHTPHLSAHDYPVFTPSYDDHDPLPTYQKSTTENRNYAESWGEHTFDREQHIDETSLSDYRTPNASSRKGTIPSEFMNFNGHICPTEEDQNSYTNKVNSRSRRHSMGDIQSVSSCNRCKPAVISSESDGMMVIKNGKKSNIIVPLTDSHASLHSQPRNKGLGFSWLFTRLKKRTKNKNESSPSRSEEVSVVSIETLKKELMEVNESRDAALHEVEEMKTSLGDLTRKLEYLETYCEELKTALRSFDGNVDRPIPLNEEVMVDAFLQAVSEARKTTKQFCKTLLNQFEGNDRTLVDNVNALLQPYKLTLDSKYSKLVLYHLEAIINQSLYQDFENCVFQKNGTPTYLDPQEYRKARFHSFLGLRNLSWDEVMRKGTKFYSEELSKFCDQKMSGIITALRWTRAWPEKLLQAFFVAGKCIWLMHLLAFSFNPAVGIMRVDESMVFDGDYMEDVLGDRQNVLGFSRVKVMVMPGFYVVDKVLKCKVLCTCKSMS